MGDDDYKARSEEVRATLARVADPMVLGNKPKLKSLPCTRPGDEMFGYCY